MGDADAAHHVINMIGEIGRRDLARLRVLLQKRRDGGDLDDAAHVLQGIELFIVEVAGMIAERPHA